MCVLLDCCCLLLTLFASLQLPYRHHYRHSLTVELNLHTVARGQGYNYANWLMVGALGLGMILVLLCRGKLQRRACDLAETSSSKSTDSSKVVDKIEVVPEPQPQPQPENSPQPQPMQPQLSQQPPAISTARLRQSPPLFTVCGVGVTASHHKQHEAIMLRDATDLTKGGIAFCAGQHAMTRGRSVGP